LKFEISSLDFPAGFLLSLAVRWAIHHKTQYAYAAPVSDSFNEVRLQPLSNGQQTVESFELSVAPAARLRHYHDFYSNCVHYFEIPAPHQSLTVESRLSIVTQPAPGLPLDARPAAMSRLAEALRGERAHDFLLSSHFVDLSPETWHFAVDATQGETDVWQCALRLMHFLFGHLRYDSNSTHVHTHMRDVLKERKGVCQDFAHAMLGLCRTLKIPALYVSGYLASETASATHAWTEVFVPGAGWQPLDPTHNRIPDETYVKIGVGRDYADVRPVSGTYKGTTRRAMTVEVRTERRD
jgi:transglutaminase-like putative cysteine protease